MLEQYLQILTIWTIHRVAPMFTRPIWTVWLSLHWTWPSMSLPLILVHTGRVEALNMYKGWPSPKKYAWCLAWNTLVEGGKEQYWPPVSTGFLRKKLTPGNLGQLFISLLGVLSYSSLPRHLWRSRAWKNPVLSPLINELLKLMHTQSDQKPIFLNCAA